MHTAGGVKGGGGLYFKDLGESVCKMKVRNCISDLQQTANYLSRNEGDRRHFLPFLCVED